jgi:YD repeat-containing protein
LDFRLLGLVSLGESYIVLIGYQSGYDDSGNLTSFIYDGDSYYYGKNLQGDITKIYDQQGNEVASYTYDAWGNVLTSSGNMAQLTSSVTVGIIMM